MNAESSAWLSSVDGLPAVHARLRRVVILHGDALEVIRQQDGPGTFYFLDPTYLRSTRTSPDVYAHEMSEGQHVALLETLADIQGRFMLCGYPSELYAAAEAQHGWRHVDFHVPNHASGAKRKALETERVWMNYLPR
ncbi:MAG TPA: hypothetical protein VG826_19650 [Pirellulales bacterium]|nr:hypothetical protein [Pirellulales bacterium]